MQEPPPVPPRPPVPPEGEPPGRVVREVHVDEEAQPATVGELRSVRRWLLVTGAWAVAATAIAVIALIAANKDDTAEAERQSARTAGQVEAVERQLNERIDDLEQRTDELPQSEDVGDLDNRLKRLETRAGRTSDQVEQLSGRLDELEQQVEALEQAPTDTTETETTP